MKTYDWIVVGGGIAGAALGYELAQQGAAVLLLEQFAELQGATRYSYGGLAYWSGTTDLTRQLCAEGIAYHRRLSEELEGDTQFRELDLLLTIAPDADSTALADFYAACAIPPQFLTGAEACEREPLLNPHAIAGAFTVPHGHIDPVATTQAYLQAMLRQGGVVEIDSVVGFLRQGDRVTGVRTATTTYAAANVVVCAGGLSRALLHSAGIEIPLYFTHAELLETPPLELQLRTLVMPADQERFALETEVSTASQEPSWQEPGHELAPLILDPGAVQFLDGHLCIGQISRVLTDPQAVVDATQSEAQIRTQVGEILPDLRAVPGTWHHCLVAFSRDRLPLVGALPGLTGIHLFSGFSTPLVFIPPLARRFADFVNGQEDEIMVQLTPARFVASAGA